MAHVQAVARIGRDLGLLFGVGLNGTPHEAAALLVSLDGLPELLVVVFKLVREVSYIKIRGKNNLVEIYHRR